MVKILHREKRKSQSGRVYFNYYQKTKKEWKGREVVSKSGKRYRTYYLKKYNPGLAPHSKINKSRCLERDNHTCQICGATLNLDVHHKDNGGAHIKGNKTDNSLSNLITLCHRCHIKLHYGVLGKDAKILSRRQKGETFQSIADSYGVSRQRIHQLIQKLGNT